MRVFFLSIFFLTTFSAPGHTEINLSGAGWFAGFPIIIIQAQLLAYGVDTRTVAAEGKAVIHVGNDIIYSDKACVRIDHWILYSQGNARIQTTKGTFSADIIILDIEKKRVYLQNFNALHGLKVFSFPDFNSRTNSGEIPLESLVLHSEVVQCKSYITASKIRLHPNLKFKAWNTTVHIEGIPVLRWPWLTLDLNDADLKRGFVWHALHYGSSSGAEAEYRYYFSDQINGRAVGNGYYRKDDAHKYGWKGNLDLSGSLFASPAYSMTYASEIRSDDQFKISLVQDLKKNNYSLLLNIRTERDYYGKNYYQASLDQEFHWDTNTVWKWKTDYSYPENIRSEMQFDFPIRHHLLLQLTSSMLHSYNQDYGTGQQEMGHAFSVQWNPEGLNLSLTNRWDRYFTNNISRYQPNIKFEKLPVQLGNSPFQLGFQNDFMYSRDYGDTHSENYRNLTRIQLDMTPVQLCRKTTLRYSLSLGADLRTGQNDYLINDFSILLSHETQSDVLLEIEYVHNMRQEYHSPGWVQGQSYQELTWRMRRDIRHDLGMDVAVLMDPGIPDVRSTDMKINWHSQYWAAQIECYYDFDLEKLSDLNLSISRDIELFVLRFMWRKIQDDFRVEIARDIF